MVSPLDEDTVESVAVVWDTFDKEAADRTAMSVDDFCESGFLIEQDAELAMDLEVEGTIRLIEGEVTEIAVARES